MKIRILYIQFVTLALILGSFSIVYAQDEDFADGDGYSKFMLIYPAQYTLRNPKVYTKMEMDGYGSDFEQALLDGLKNSESKITGFGFFLKTIPGVELGYEAYKLETLIAVDMTEATILALMQTLGLTRTQAIQQINSSGVNMELSNTLESELTFFTIGYSATIESFYIGGRYGFGQSKHKFEDSTSEYDDKGTNKFSINFGIKADNFVIGLEYNIVNALVEWKEDGNMEELDLGGSLTAISIGFVF